MGGTETTRQMNLPAFKGDDGGENARGKIQSFFQ